MNNPIDTARALIGQFSSASKRDKLVVSALRKLLDAQQFDAATQLVKGPKIGISDVARSAGISRNLINHSGCELMAARELVIAVIETLSNHNLEAKCAYLTLENERLQRLVDYHVSETAGLMLRLGDEVGLTTKVDGAKKRTASTPNQLRAAAEILPMFGAGVAKKQRS